MLQNAVLSQILPNFTCSYINFHMFLGWREEYCKMVVQLCSWIFELCSCIWKICVEWQLKVEDWDVPLKNFSNYPPPSRIHRTLRQPPSWKSAWEITPTTPPSSNSPNVATTPLLESAWEITPTTPPPRIHRTLRQPPSWKIGLRNHSNYPPPRIYSSERGICAVGKNP